MPKRKAIYKPIPLFSQHLKKQQIIIPKLYNEAIYFHNSKKQKEHTPKGLQLKQKWYTQKTNNLSPTRNLSPLISSLS